MIKVNIKENKVTISGHSGYDEKGKDIVCASVSTMIITSVNAILMFDKSSINYEISDGHIEIEILKHQKETDILISNMINLLKELETKYKKKYKNI